MHAKTGTYWVDNELTGKAMLTSKAMAGYLETASGRPLVFAFFVNNVGLDAPRPGGTVSTPPPTPGAAGQAARSSTGATRDPARLPRDPPGRPRPRPKRKPGHSTEMFI